MPHTDESRHLLGNDVGDGTNELVLSFPCDMPYSYVHDSFPCDMTHL